MLYLAIFLWIVMIVLGGIAVLSTRNRGAWAGGAVACAVLGFGFFFWAGIHSVPPKSIGVPVSLGQVESGYYGPGAHVTWDPFLNLAIINETIQTTTFETGSNLPGTSQCNGELPVRIGGQQSACAKITIQWRVKPAAASSLFSDYANQGDLMTTIENALVIRELEVVVNQQVGEYDPITDYQNVVNSNSATSQFTAFGPEIQATMTRDIGSQVQVTSVLFPKMTYSASVESKLQQIQQAYANFAIATENVKVNQENALGFAKLGNPTVTQLVAQCLNDVAKDNASPMGCFPGQASGLTIGK